MKRAAFFIILPVLLLLLLAATRLSFAQSVPTIISHQGRLLNASSQPVTTNVSVEFRIFNALSGGSQVWTETQSITPDNLGFYDTFLGGTTALPSTLPNPSYLQITVQGETLTPRLQFGSVPFAQRADIANSATTATTATTASSANTAALASNLNCAGCVGTTDIADATVTSRKVKPILETILLSYGSFAFPADPATVPGSIINFTADVPSKILANLTVSVYSGGSVYAAPLVWIEVDGVEQYPRAWSQVAASYTGSTRLQTLSTHIMNTVGSGNHSVSIKAYGDGDETQIIVQEARLTVQAFAQ